MRGLPLVLAALVVLSPLSQPVFAPDQARVAFEKGNDNAEINGTIVGNEYIDYLLGAKKGQQMAVSLIPGESNGNGSIDGLEATGILLPGSGDYVIRVYQMGNDADPGKTTAFMISVGIM